MSEETAINSSSLLWVLPQTTHSVTLRPENRKKWQCLGDKKKKFNKNCQKTQLSRSLRHQVAVAVGWTFFLSSWTSPKRRACASFTRSFHANSLSVGHCPRPLLTNLEPQQWQSESGAPRGGLTWQHSILQRAACKYLCYTLDNTGHRNKAKEFISEFLWKWKKRKENKGRWLRVE